MSVYVCVRVCVGGVHTCDASNAVPLLSLVLTYARADGESECSDERRLFLCKVLDLAGSWDARLGSLAVIA